MARTEATHQYWLRPRIARDGDVTWAIIEAEERPTPESMGPFESVAQAASSAEPDHATLAAGVGRVA